MKAAASIETISIWILEALEEEWRREPDWLKCRLASEVLGPLKPAHQIEDADITRGLHFLMDRRYIKALNRSDGQALLPSDDGLAMLAKIDLSRIEEQEKKQWTRADKIALASLLFSVITFCLGLFIGDHLSKKSDNVVTPLQQTNNPSDASPK